MPLKFLQKATRNFFLILNLIAGILFLGGSFGNYFDPDKFWYLSVLTVILPYLIIILLLFIILWLVLRSLKAIISIIFLAVGWNAVMNIFPLRLPYSFQIKKPANTIRIMSWNVEQLNIQNYKTHPERKQEIFDLINLYNPDVACLQEVVAGEDPEAINYLPEIDSQLHFKEYSFAYQLKNDFDRHHHFGTIIFSKFPMVRKQFMVNNPDDYNSTFQFVDLLVGHDTIRVFNVHLQSLKFSKENREYLDSGQITTSAAQESRSVLQKFKTGVLKRAVQARFVKDEMNHTPYPKILCGDFNDVPVSYAYAVIGKNMQNAFVKKGFGFSRTFDGIAPTLRIDNIFADSNFIFTQFTRVKKELSDHFPIIADVKLVKGK